MTTQSETAISPAEVLATDLARIANEWDALRNVAEEAIDDHPDETPPQDLVDVLNLAEGSSEALYLAARAIREQESLLRAARRELRFYDGWSKAVTAAKAAEPPAPVVVQTIKSCCGCRQAGVTQRTAPGETATYGRELSYADMVERLGESGKLVG